MSAEGVPVAEREAFAAYITSQENIGFDAVVWRGVGGDPLGIVHEPQYSENSLRSEWAAWQARAAITHPAAASAEREAQIRAEVIKECAKVCDDYAERARRLSGFAEAGHAAFCASAIRALSARATKEL